MIYAKSLFRDQGIFPYVEKKPMLPLFTKNDKTVNKKLWFVSDMWESP